MPTFMAGDEGSLVGMCMQDYKSPCAMVKIYVNLVDPQLDF